MHRFLSHVFCRGPASVVENVGLVNVVEEVEPANVDDDVKQSTLPHVHDEQAVEKGVPISSLPGPHGTQLYSIRGSAAECLRFDTCDFIIPTTTIYISPSTLLDASFESSKPEHDLDKDAGEKRLCAWGLARVALSGIVSEENLFRSHRPGPSFTLQPAFQSSVPLQWVHVGPGAIPDSLADLRCAAMSSTDLLNHLNDIVGTDHLPSTDGMHDLVEHIRCSSYDLGEAYGKVRFWWQNTEIATTGRKHYDTLHESEYLWNSFRNGAIRDSSLQTSLLPPRRVWDLYSNRVLAFTVLMTLTPEAGSKLPDRLWTVSHSWVAEEEREEVWTTINGKEWPVPIPRSTTLEHVRIELLNMGAEYIWLDVLCLRQQGRDVDEPRRMEEWETDVPTIGHIYQGHPSRRPCITYFNGLGLPIDTSPTASASDRHWFNRVWTLQESLRSWLPGGLTGYPIPNAASFFGRVRALWKLNNTRGLAKELMRRHSTKEVDRIAGLAYILGCKTLPLYKEGIDIEHAWEIFVKHVQSKWRTNLVCCFAVDAPFALFPSWEAYGCGPRFLHLSFAAHLSLEDEAVLHTLNSGTYSITAPVFGPLRIARAKSAPSASETLDSAGLQLELESHPKTNHKLIGHHKKLTAKAIHGILLESVYYHIVEVKCSRTSEDLCWVAVEMVE